MSYSKCIFDLQPISQNTPDNVVCPHWLVPTIEMIKYSFVRNHQLGQCVSQALASLNAKHLCVTKTKVHNLCP